MDLLHLLIKQILNIVHEFVFLHPSNHVEFNYRKNEVSLF